MLYETKNMRSIINRTHDKMFMSMTNYTLWARSVYHRHDKVARMYSDGERNYIVVNVYHRDNGPTIVYTNGDAVTHTYGKNWHLYRKHR